MIRQSLLAILDQEPCYGYQLRLEFERRTGLPLNVGQVYTTLDRLERDGLARKGEIDAEGHVFYEITAQGRAEARGWLASATDRTLTPRDELAVKLALALTLPGADAAALLTAQRAATTAALARYRAEPHGTLAAQLARDALVLAAEAELTWLDNCAARLHEARQYPVDAEPVRRGRPVRA